MEGLVLGFEPSDIPIVDAVTSDIYREYVKIDNEYAMRPWAVISLVNLYDNSVKAVRYYKKLETTEYHYGTSFIHKLESVYFHTSPDHSITAELGICIDGYIYRKFIKSGEALNLPCLLRSSGGPQYYIKFSGKIESAPVATVVEYKKQK
jgi:hypothetical protein